MAFLVKVGGEIYLPTRECSAGQNHYTTVDAEFLTVEVDTRRPLLWHLKTLLNQLSINGDELPDERVNLLWQGNTRDLEVRLSDIVDPIDQPSFPQFDFFVEGRNGEFYSFNIPNPERLRRFSYNSGQIFFDGKRLKKQVKVRDVYGNIPGKDPILELFYIGSRGVELTNKTDYDVVDEFDRRERETAKSEIMTELGGRVKDKNLLNGLSIDAARVLLCLVESHESQPEYPAQSIYDVADYLKSDDYYCACAYDEEEVAEAEAVHSLDELIERGLVEMTREDGEEQFKVTSKVVLPVT